VWWFVPESPNLTRVVRAGFGARVDQGRQQVITGWVEPVLTCRDWRVEATLLDGPAGLRPGFLVHHDGQVRTCRTAAELHDLLQCHGLDLGDLVAPGPGLDGCE
jgi:hypothetical protein